MVRQDVPTVEWAIDPSQGCATQQCSSDPLSQHHML